MYKWSLLPNSTKKLYNIFIILCLCNNANCREYLGRVGFSDQASITPEKFDREGLNQNSDAQFLLIDILIGVYDALYLRFEQILSARIIAQSCKYYLALFLMKEIMRRFEKTKNGE